MIPPFLKEVAEPEDFYFPYTWLVEEDLLTIVMTPPKISAREHGRIYFQNKLEI